MATVNSKPTTISLDAANLAFCITDFSSTDHTFGEGDTIECLSGTSIQTDGVETFGQCTINAKFDPTAMATLKTALDGRTVHAIIETYEDGSTVSYSARVSQLDREVGGSKVVDATILLQKTTKDTWA